ncbi:phosphoribosylamine--glycine ligase [Allosphingosinicella indica]|uniref:Glycinamide ribonucleotide synthetase n=2 Tax=Allosphingosinicella indica TaxID=941907 RepID=A0A1X7FYT9_9SPHN|nr:phosphoribosylamine--glycine ligase [Allosphingosinicella indica]
MRYANSSVSNLSVARNWRMRFLGVSETCDLGSLYLRLIEEGHEVRVSVSEPLADGTMRGLVPRTEDWRAELDWVRAGGRGSAILFEAVSEGLGALEDDLRAQGYSVIGGSAFGDRLENDRDFAFGLLEELGFATAPQRRFDDAAAGHAYIAERPHRYALKFHGAGDGSARNFVGVRDDGADVAAVLRAARGASLPPFVLMDFVAGVEMGIGGYFNGARFLRPTCLDWEHKRFFPGDLGELTGEMGTIATYRSNGEFFRQTLERIEPALRAHGHVGYVNLNTIVNESGIFPLEFTCRFGYPGFAVLDPLQTRGWGDLFARMSDPESTYFETSADFSAGVVVTTPPFPYSRKEVEAPVGLPVWIDKKLHAADRAHIHWGEVGMSHDMMVTSGLYGWSAVVTGTGPTVVSAASAAYEHLEALAISDMRYREDIGDKLIRSDLERVQSLGLI